MSNNTTPNGTAEMNDKLAASRREVQGFGRHYGYDVSYLEALMEASPDAFLAYQGGAAMGRFRKKAPVDLMMIAKLTTARVEDCGSCLELGIKMAKEAGVPETVVRNVLHGGRGLSQEHLDIYNYARAVATNEAMDPELLPRITERHGREVVAELALAIIAMRMHPAMKRALGYAKSCSQVPGLVA